MGVVAATAFELERQKEDSKGFGFMMSRSVRKAQIPLLFGITEPVFKVQLRLIIWLKPLPEISIL